MRADQRIDEPIDEIVRFASWRHDDQIDAVSLAASRCFTLYQNGTYEYSAESSSGGAYGSTAGQSYDSGRWTATRTTITAYSNAHGKIVYPIELRNHPKTGDPMIVLDGDAYVTTTQRRPW